ncbi:hypothetical protein D4R71_05865 [bacterium]|nr:MAG: hypothetical protein D4R71_05865 [bacterium]
MKICFVKSSEKVILIEKSFHLCFSIYKQGKPISCKPLLKNIISVKINWNIHTTPHSWTWGGYIQYSSHAPEMLGAKLDK